MKRLKNQNKVCKDESLESKKQKYPISKYVGKFPTGEWIFVKYVNGTYEDALQEARKLQLQDPKTGKKINEYRIWE